MSRDHYRFERSSFIASPMHDVLSGLVHAIFMSCEEVQTIIFERIEVARICIRTVPALPQNDDRLCEAFWKYHLPVWLRCHHAR